MLKREDVRAPAPLLSLSPIETDLRFPVVDVLEDSKPTAESSTDVEDGESESKPTPVPESDDESELSEGSDSESGSGEYPSTMY